MNAAIMFIAVLVIFGGLQVLLNSKSKKTMVKCIPLLFAAAGLLFCLALYTGVFVSVTPSAAVENRYFAAFLALPLAGALAGCLAGFLLSKHILKNRHI